VSPLEDLSTVTPEQWHERYRAAVAAGRGCVICPDEERLAAPDELVALALPELVRLGALALLADGNPDPPRECAKVVSREAATVLRLLDRALAAHGRDHGYSVAAWRHQAVSVAHAVACGISRRDIDLPLGAHVLDAADAVARVVIALHRDRMGVPEELTEALGSVLVLHVAAALELA
jgi:Zn ribbon nucleic-acid-binding protein